MIFRWIGTLLVLALFPYRGMVQGAVLADRSALKTRDVLVVSLGNLLLLLLGVVGEALFGFFDQEVFPSPWVAVTFVVAFVGGIIIGWKKSDGEDQSPIAA